jgi:predicted GNAT family acetyltransferase
MLAPMRLRPGDTGALLRLLDADPVGNAYLRSEARLGLDGADWWGLHGSDGLRGVVAGGALVVPCVPTLADAVLFAEAMQSSSIPRLLVGPRDQVLALHAALTPTRTPREVRDPQPLLVMAASGLRVQPSSPVRRATRGDLDGLSLAAAAMHREEMGFDPLAADASAWRARMASLIERGWAWVWTAAGRVIFKTELSAWTPDVVQLQGVYTDPAHRGQGVATAALASVCAALFGEVELCSLYVNHYNTAALSVYQRLGFERVADFATVIY